jgi:hypothetical protein
MRNAIGNLLAGLYLKIEGINPGQYWPCDTYVREVANAFMGNRFTVDYRPLTTEDSEYPWVWEDPKWLMDGDELMSLDISESCDPIPILQAMDESGLYLLDELDNGGESDRFHFSVTSDSSLLIVDGHFSIAATEEVARYLAELATKDPHTRAIFPNELLTLLDKD